VRRERATVDPDGPAARRVVRAVRRLATAALATAGVAGLLTAVPAPATAGAPALEPRPVVTGWMPYWSPAESTAAVTGHADLFREASPFFFSTSAGAVNLQGSSTSLRSMVSSLHAHGITVIPTFTTSMNADQFAALLSDRSARRAHVRMLVRTAAAYGADGVDLDYENINFGSSAARDVVRAKYPVLVSQLDAALAAAGMLSSVTVPARRSDSDPNWWVYAYGPLGRHADRFRIMTYDYSWSGGAPGPISPRSWVDEVLAYAVTRVPAARISFGMPSYGYDWYTKTVKGRCGSSAKSTVSRTSAQMIAFAANRGIDPVWNANGTSRTFSYRAHYGNGCVVRRVAWYDDARSFRTKLPLVAKYHVRGVAIWALGNETPVMWRTMHRYAMRVAVRPTLVRASTPDHVVFGTRTRARGTVLVGGKPRAGVPVTLWRRPVGGSGWTKVGQATSGSDGHVAIEITPRSHMQYQMRTPRAWAYTAGRSDVSTTRVSYRVALDRTGARRSVSGRTATVSGQVTPGSGGVVVRKQFLRDGRWVTVPGRTTVDAHGRFSVTVQARHPMTRTLRLVATAGRLDMGTSGTLRLTFR
jgi:spore germination protein